MRGHRLSHFPLCFESILGFQSRLGARESGYLEWMGKLGPSKLEA